MSLSRKREHSQLRHQTDTQVTFHDLSPMNSAERLLRNGESSHAAMAPASSRTETASPPVISQSKPQPDHAEKSSATAVSSQATSSSSDIEQTDVDTPTTSLFASPALPALSASTGVSGASSPVVGASVVTGVSASQPIKLKCIKETVCKVSPGLAPVRLCLNIINPETKEIVRMAGLEFHSKLSDLEGNPRRTSNASISTQNVPDGSPTGNNPNSAAKHILKFTYSNRVIFGVDNVPETWADEAKIHLRYLKSLPRSGSIQVILPFDPNMHPVRAGRLLAYLNHSAPSIFFPPLKHRPLDDKKQNSKYLNTWHELQWAYGQGNKLNVRRNQKVMSQCFCLSGPTEAELRIVHGRYADYLWEKELKEDISHRRFRGVFAKTRSGTVLALLRICNDGQGRLPRMSDRTALEVSFDAIGYTNGIRMMKCFAALGQLTTNQSNLSCDLVLVLRQVPKRMLEKANENPRVEDLTGSSVEALSVDVRVKDYLQAKMQIESVNTFFDQNMKLYRKFWAGFLGVSSPQLEPKNFLTGKLRHTQATVDWQLLQIQHKLSLAGMNLNPEQMAIHRKTGITYGGFRLIMGPPGTGKSTLIAILACTLLQFPRTAVLLVAPSNGAASKLYGSMKAVLDVLGMNDPSCKPLRIFRKYYEQDYFLKWLDPESAVEDGNLFRGSDKDVANLLEEETNDWYSRQLEAEDRRLMDEPTNGLMAAVIQAYKDGNLHQSSAICDAETSRSDKQSYDVRQARKALGELKLYKEGMMKIKNQHEIHKRARAVGTQLIGTRRVVVCTADNATSLTAKDGIFRDFESVNIFFDEQTLATEASTLNVLAGTINKERVSDEYGNNVPIDSITLVGDHKQGVPLVQSQRDNANLFGEQMVLSTFERLVKVGMPYDQLLEQHRMAPILREIPNKRCYDGQLRDSAEAQSRMLTDQERNTLRLILKYPVPAFEDYLHTTAVFENRHLRHLLLDVSSEETLEKETASRLNSINIKVTIILIKYLLQTSLVTPHELVVLTFYNAQKKEYIRALSALESNLKLPKGTFDDCVETSDSFQGRERKCVILDFVVTRYGKDHGMGNVSEERKMNVACTRARDYFFVVACTDVIEGWAEHGPRRMEYGIEVLRELEKRKAIVDVDMVKKLVKQGMGGSK